MIKSVLTDLKKSKAPKHFGEKDCTDFPTLQEIAANRKFFDEYDENFHIVMPIPKKKKR